MNDEDAASPDAGWENMKGSLPPPQNPADAADLLWREFRAQFGWYDRAAVRNRWFYQILKLLALAAGAAVTVLAALEAPRGLTASVGAAIVIIEGAQQIGQFHANWINYRATAEVLRQHGFFYAAGTAPYQHPATRRDHLARLMRETIAKESGVWTEEARKDAQEENQ